MDRASPLNALWTLLRKPGWLQRAIQTNAAWPAEAEVADQQANRPGLGEDGAHPSRSPFYVEWWYFDATDETGAAISVILHMTDLVRPAASTGSLNVRLSLPGRPPVQRFLLIPRSEIQAAAGRFDLRAGESYVSMEGDRRYRIHIRAGDLKIELEFLPETPAWRPGNGIIEFGRPEAYFAWVVMEPKARVSGWIEVAGEQIRFEGTGYHDHNWGTISLLEGMKHWSWGRVYLDRLTCVYADIQLSERYGGRRMMPFAILDDRQALVSSFLDSHNPLDLQWDFLRDPQATPAPSGWALAWERGDQSFQLALRIREVLEYTGLLAGSGLRKWMLRRLVADPWYIRCLSSAEATWRNGERSRTLAGIAISEQITLQR